MQFNSILQIIVFMKKAIKYHFKDLMLILNNVYKLYFRNI